ncbi:MAG: hypothetical protein B7Y53_03430, partial [Halothiobacillus sp. 28-55-5]
MQTSMPSHEQIQANAERLIRVERENYLRLHPHSVALAAKANHHFLYGVPMHWMNDWGTPVPLFVKQAQG